jgi:hypothetical protein
VASAGVGDSLGSSPLPVLNRREKGELFLILSPYAARGTWVMKLCHKSSNEKKINQKGK